MSGSTTARSILKMLPKEFSRDIARKSYLEGALDAAYNQPRRFYHNLDHISTMLTQLDSLMGMEIIMPPNNSFYAAILFHDFVYDVQAQPSVNETYSALMATEILDECMYRNSFSWADVRTLIMATTHTEDLFIYGFGQQLIADLDLATLGTVAFWKINDAVRAEYEQVYTKQEVQKGRKEFLTKMLAKDHIYYTSWFQDNREAEARNNIQLCLTAMESEK